jgi:hypothetical protein
MFGEVSDRPHARATNQALGAFARTVHLNHAVSWQTALRHFDVVNQLGVDGFGELTNWKRGAHFRPKAGAPPHPRTPLASRRHAISELNWF